MEYEVPTILETQLTGWLGTAHRNVKRVPYAVRFVRQAGEIAATPSRDGRPCD